MQKNNESKRRQGKGLPIALVVSIVLLLLAGCGEESSYRYSPVDRGGDRGGATEDTPDSTRNFASGLAVGEALDGIHLRPGVEIINIDSSRNSSLVIDEVASTMRLSLEDFEALLEEYEEIWSGDILSVDDLLFIIDGVRSVGREIVIELGPFELFEVVHGEWDYTNEDFVEADEVDDLRTIEQPMGSEGSNVDQKGFSWGDLVGGEVDISVSGSIDFPLKWVDDARFRGRISRWGQGIGTDYTCRTYTEEVTRRRYRLFGERITVVQEVQPENFCIDYILVRGYFGVEHELEIAVAPTVKLEKKFGPERPHLFTTFYVPIGTLPFNIRISPYMHYGLEAKIEGALKWAKESGASIRVPIGFEYNPHDPDHPGMALLPNDNAPANRVQISQKPMNWTETPPLRPDVEVQASLKAFAELGVIFGLGVGQDRAVAVSVKGPKIAGEIAAVGKYNPLEPACLTGDVYLRAYGKAELQGRIAFGGWSWGINIVGGAEYDLFKRSILPGGPLESAGDDYCLVSLEEQGPEDLKVTLEWDSTTDLDLYVEHPNYGRIFWGRRDTPDGAVYHGDNCINQECDADTAFEIIEWENGRPEAGTYEVWVVNFGGSAAANFTITVETENGVLETFSGSVGAERNAQSSRYEFVIPEE